MTSAFDAPARRDSLAQLAGGKDSRVRLNRNFAEKNQMVGRTNCAPRDIYLSTCGPQRLRGYGAGLRLYHTWTAIRSISSSGTSSPSVL
jgi:hypothetical protein